MLQRYHTLNAAGRQHLLDEALSMIERRRDDHLPPDRREAKQLIHQITWRIERMAELKASGKGHAEDLRFLRVFIQSDKERLAKLGITYFGSPMQEGGNGIGR